VFVLFGPVFLVLLLFESLSNSYFVDWQPQGRYLLPSLAGLWPFVVGLGNAPRAARRPDLPLGAAGVRRGGERRGRRLLRRPARMNTRSGHPDRRASLADLLRGCLTGDPLAEEPRDGRFTFTASIPDGHPIYEGHFPRVAILPGAVELLLVELVATRAIGRPLRAGADRRHESSPARSFPASRSRSRGRGGPTRRGASWSKPT